MEIQILVWPDSINELIVEYVEKNNIDPHLIEIRSENEIVVHNPNSEEPR